MATKRMQKLLDGASIKDKIKLLSSNNAAMIETGKPLYSKNEIKEIMDSIWNDKQSEEYESIMLSISSIIGRRGELYFEGLRMSYYTHLLTIFFEKLTDYGRRLSVINEHINELESIPGTDEAVRNLISKMIDNDPEDKAMTYFHVVEVDGRLKLCGEPIRANLEEMGQEYKYAIEIAKTTYKAFHEFLEMTDISELIPNDIKSMVELLKKANSDILGTIIDKDSWNNLLDLPAIDKDMSIVDRFGVAELYPSFESASYREHELGENNRFLKDLKQNEQGN